MVQKEPAFEIPLALYPHGSKSKSSKVLPSNISLKVSAWLFMSCNGEDTAQKVKSFALGMSVKTTSSLAGKESMRPVVSVASDVASDPFPPPALSPDPLERPASPRDPSARKRCEKKDTKVW